ncbi:MAG: VOC family protein [Intrasporangium sp.]|uniref:VOC family protein n=1 Tax=Intrasporangium sp. TaxID=1925024 RepID=UPI003F7D2979
MPAPESPFVPGTPCWADLLVEDVERAATFYEEVLGWRAPAPTSNEAGYRVAKRNGRVVAGIGRKPVEDVGMTPTWTIYLAVDDPGAATDRAEAAGAEVGSEPDQDRGFGRAAVLVDPAGASVGLWETGAHSGMELLGEPGAMCWSETMSRDYEASKGFYSSVFGWQLEEIGDGGFRYAVARLGEGDPVAGIGALPSDAGIDDASQWRVYFAVEDCDATVARIPGLGGGVPQLPQDTPYGRTAVVAGPEGETFAIMQLPDRG